MSATVPGGGPRAGGASPDGQPQDTRTEPAQAVSRAAASGAAAQAGPGSGDDVLVRVENLVKYFPVKGGGLFARTVGQVQAVDGISLNIPRGRTVGLVGETGCG